MRRARTVAIVGAGPAGLWAGLRLAEAGAAVTVFDHMASPARKLLLAGRGGLNLTHSEAREPFLARYGTARAALGPAIDAFPPSALRAFADELGETTFVGSSGRVFPTRFKASPLVRAWLGRLAAAGATLRMRHRFAGFGSDGALVMDGPDGRTTVAADAVLLALGGASWPRMGSDGGWVALLEAAGIVVAPLVPSNMGVEIAWSAGFTDRFGGAPLKRITLACGGRSVAGEAMITTHGLEGSAVYGLSAAIRGALATGAAASLVVDLKPDLPANTIAARLATARSGDSLSNTLKKRIGLAPQAVALLRESAGRDLPRDPEALAALVRGAPLALKGVRPLERAISTAGGIRFEAITPDFELLTRPGLFVAGEMLDWDAPTGGYLLQATFATAEAAARGMAVRLGLSLPARRVRGW
ncbi:NAD(P)/FAD-dependent oxidoreductase [Phreatobacter sp.]|uniref:NAD(P)/FAD-dependent oxidoreductase n=1 Tax=Phreatobacter sp. TaxID=1966341 RepID=UPI003F702C39